MDERAVKALEAEVAEICGQLNVLHARLAAKVAEALEQGLWSQVGIHTPAQWLAWQTGLSPARARQLIAVARARADFPVVMEAFDAGELAVDQAVVCVKAPAWTDAQTCDFAKVMTVSQLSKVVHGYSFDDKPAAHPEDDPQPQEVSESYSGWFGDDGRYRFAGELDPDRGRLMDAAVREARDRLFRGAPLDERGKITNADALVDLCTRAMDSVPLTRRERFRVNVHLEPVRPGRSDVADPLEKMTMTFSDGWGVPGWLRDLLLCDGSIVPVVTESGVPVSVGRTLRIVPDRTRRLVEHRDRGCRVPGCDRSRHVEVHHIVHDEDHGGTDTWNLVCLCPQHHRLHHQGKLGISGNADDPDGLVFTDARGRPLAACGSPKVPTGPPPQPARPYQHPLGERLDYHAVYFNPPRPSPQPAA